ncbi:MAG: hypothetical protein AABX07_01345, partial [Nanoarchaeota archaeon]
YTAKGYCNIGNMPLSSCENVRLIYSNYSSELRADAGIENIVRFTPTEKGQFSFILIANASRDVNLENNFRYVNINTRNSGAELSGWISTTDNGKATIGQLINISINIYNRGNEKTINGTLKLYVEESRTTCTIGEDCPAPAPPILLISKDIEIDADKEINAIYEYTPQKEGDLRFIAVLNASNEIEGDNTFGDNLRIIKRGVDMAVYFANLEYGGFSIKGEQIRFNVSFTNEGLENATNVTYYIYAREIGGNKNTGYGIKQISYKFITHLKIAGAIKPGQTISAEMRYTPQNKGQVEFMANITATGEVDFENNQNSIGRMVKNKGKDLAVDNVGANDLKIGETGQIFAYLSNVGNESLKDINVSLIINGRLIEKKSLDIPFGAREWEGQKTISFDYTPIARGILNVTVNAFVSGEKDISDNQYKTEISVYEIIPINISAIDSKGNAVNRFLSGGAREIFINGTFPKPIDFYDDGSEKSAMSISVASFRDEEEIQTQTDAFIQSVSFAGLKNIAASENITSEYYANISQNGIWYYSVFANKPTFNYTSFNTMVVMMKEYLERIGMNFNKIDDWTLFYCTRFDFNLRQCANQWNKINQNLITRGEEGKRAIFYINMDKGNIKGKVEAFALSKIPNLPQVRANIELAISNSMPDLILEDDESAYGKIEFKDAVDVSRIKRTNSLLQNYVVFNNRKVSVDTNNLSELKGKAAKVTIENIAMRNPQIYYNGASCPLSVCNNKNYNSAERYITFDVSGFSSFEIVEGNYCGDGVCQAGNNENCGSCPSDCSICAVQSAIPSGGCLPKWNCTWGACVNNARKEICVDLRNCRINFRKPIEKTELCLERTLNCADLDKDGYGIGADCLGRDVNDNDVTVTTALREQERTNLGISTSSAKNSIADNEKKNKQIYYLIGLFVFAILIVFVLIAVAYTRNRRAVQQINSEKNDSAKISADSIKKAAKDWVKENRTKGYSNEEI